MNKGNGRHSGTSFDDQIGRNGAKLLFYGLKYWRSRQESNLQPSE